MNCENFSLQNYTQYNDLPVLTKNAGIICHSTFKPSGSFLPSGHKNSLHLSIKVKIVSLPKFDEQMVYNSIPFDFPFRIICFSYQIPRQHP